MRFKIGDHVQSKSCGIIGVVTGLLNIRTINTEMVKVQILENEGRDNRLIEGGSYSFYERDLALSNLRIDEVPL